MTTPYDIYPAVMQVIDLVSQGRTLTAACDEQNIKIVTFEKYIEASAELQDLMREAVRRGHDAMVDALLDPDGMINPDSPYARTDPKMAKIISENIKWRLEKQDSKRFGQKVEVKHNITADRAIIDALNAAKNRTAQIGYEDVIDVQAIPLTEEEEIAAMCGYAPA